METSYATVFKRFQRFIWRTRIVKRKMSFSWFSFSALLIVYSCFKLRPIPSQKYTAIAERGLPAFNKTQCKRNVSDLAGPISPKLEPIEKSNLISLFPSLKGGGRFSPNCSPSWKVAVVIPYRNRWNHLNILLQNLIPVLMRQKIDFGIFVIEQEKGNIFNKGVLYNAGFLEAQNRWDCFVLHDVDLIPLDDRCLYHCNRFNPVHMVSGLNKWNYTLMKGPYTDDSPLFGGVVALTKQQFLQINGFSNLYFGWGGEDDDFSVRVRNVSFPTLRYPANICRYDMIKHLRDKGNDDNPLRRILLKTTTARQQQEGLSTASGLYHVTHRETLPLYTWITVAVDFKLIHSKYCKKASPDE